MAAFRLRHWVSRERPFMADVSQSAVPRKRSGAAASGRQEACCVMRIMLCSTHDQIDSAQGTAPTLRDR